MGTFVENVNKLATDLTAPVLESIEYVTVNGDNVIAAAATIATLGISASTTPSTASGTISATNVQDALQELDTEKVPLNSDFTLDLGGL